MTFDEYEHGGSALYATFADAVAAILRSAIDEQPRLRLQNIQWRAKEPASLKVKLDKAGVDATSAISDHAKDVAGVRLIFYTNGDVHRFGQSGILRDNFDVDFGRSKIHYPKNSEDDADFFISENWVVRLNEKHSSTPEYQAFAGLLCEVQVQTILDHAWAEMAHDTIYKPMSDKGFGADAIEAMRKRLRKVMREYLQPAGYAFQKIASDYAQLREGKAMFDEGALAVIRECQDRNCLHEAIERFSNYVLPHYDDYVAAAPEIIDTLSDAAIRCAGMPDVPIDSFMGELPGTKASSLIAEICRLLEGGYLLYADPDRMFERIIAMRAVAQSEDERKPIDGLIERFSQHDRRAWQQVGPGLQRLIVDKVAALSDPALVAVAPAVTIMLRKALSSTVSGTTSEKNALVLHTGSVAVTDHLTAIRRDAIAQLKRLHALAADDETRGAVRHAMTAAGNTPNNSGYSDALGVVIMDDLTEVVTFFTEIDPTLTLEPKRELGVELFRLYHAYHALPPAMAENADLAAANARLLAAMQACRAAIDADEDLARYRTFVGFDNPSERMWEEASYDREASSTERTEQINAIVAEVTEQTETVWLDRIERYVLTESNDMAFFMGLEEFLKSLAAAKPAILIGWLPRLSPRLANWLPGMLHGLAESGQDEALEPLVEAWVAEGRHLGSIAWYLQFAAKLRFDLLSAIMVQALDAKDDGVLSDVASAAARQSNNHPDHLFDEIFLPVAQAMTERGEFGWAASRLNWGQVNLLKGLSGDQAAAFLALMADLPRLGRNGEAMLATVATEHVEAVLGLIGTRFVHEAKRGLFRYEDLPHGLHYLKPPLAAAPEAVVASAWEWFEHERALSEFRGGRLIAELFPNLGHPMQPILGAYLDTARDGIEFVLSVLRAYEGQAFLHPLLRDIVAILAPDDDLLTIVSIVIESSGVLTGHYGGVEAQEARKALVADWANDDRQVVRDFAISFAKTADNSIAFERRRADQDVAMQDLSWNK